MRIYYKANIRRKCPLMLQFVRWSNLSCNTHKKIISLEPNRRESKSKIFSLVSNVSNSLSPQELLQYVAAVPNYIHCTVFHKNGDHDIPCSTKTKFCAVFEGETPCFIYLEFNIIFANMTVSYFCWRFITLLFYAKYQHCKSQFTAQSMALFHGLVTINGKFFCSQICAQSEPKVPVQLNKAGLRSSEIRKVKKKTYFKNTLP